MSSEAQHTVVVGLAWGDEGKGKIVDLLCEGFDVVCRYNGGANAGHTVCVGGETFALHLLPTGVMREGVGAVIGCWQGYWIAYRGVPAFVVTLAGLLMFRGGAWLITEGRTVAPMNPTYQLLGGGINGSIGETWSWIVGIAAIAVLAWTTVRGRRSRS